MKKFIFLTIASIIIFSCILYLLPNNSKNTETLEHTTAPITIKVESGNEISEAFSKTHFVDKNSKKIFELVASGNAPTETGFRNLRLFLNTTEFYKTEIGQIWTLGKNCYLIVDKNRHLYLSNSDKTLHMSFDILPNIDSYNIKTELQTLTNLSSEEDLTQFIIGDISFSNGQFCHLGEIKFDLIYLGGIFKIVDYNIFSKDRIEYIINSDTRCFLVKQNGLNFEYKQITMN